MDHMTKIEGVPSTDVAKPGMAFFAGTGPAGKTCGDCALKGYMRESKKGKWSERLREMVYPSHRVGSCAMFLKLTGQHGPPVADHYDACKYFEPALKT